MFPCLIVPVSKLMLNVISMYGVEVINNNVNSNWARMH